MGHGHPLVRAVQGIAIEGVHDGARSKPCARPVTDRVVEGDAQEERQGGVDDASVAFIGHFGMSDLDTGGDALSRQMHRVGIMMRADTLHPCDLTADDHEAWRALCASSPAFASPLLGPDFANYVGRFRTDTLVTVWRTLGPDGVERPVAFLPHHRRLGGAAYPLGAPLGDYHGPVAAEGFDLEGALQGAGLTAYRFTSTIAPS